MATRYYLPTPGVNKSLYPVDLAWTTGHTNPGAVYGMVKVKSNNGQGTWFIEGDTSEVQEAHIFLQYVSPPIGACNFAVGGFGGGKFVIRAAQDSLSNNLFLTISIRVWSADGSVFRGSILNITTFGSELATTLTSRFNSFTCDNNFSAQEGDVIVLEIGLSGNPSAGANHDGDLRLGDNSASDLPENSTSTSDFNPWLEFTDTIPELAPVVVTPGALTMPLVTPSILLSKTARPNPTTLPLVTAAPMVSWRVRPNAVTMPLAVPAPTQRHTIKPLPVTIPFALTTPIMSGVNIAVTPSPLVINLLTNLIQSKYTVNPVAVVMNLNLAANLLVTRIKPNPVLIATAVPNIFLTPTADPMPVVLLFSIPQPGLEIPEGPRFPSDISMREPAIPNEFAIAIEVEFNDD